MDCATLPHAQSIILRCTQWKSWASSVFTRRQHRRYWQLSATQTDSCRLLAHTCTARGEVQTALVRFVVDMFHKQIRNKSTTWLCTNRVTVYIIFSLLKPLYTALIASAKENILTNSPISNSHNTKTVLSIDVCLNLDDCWILYFRCSCLSTCCYV